MSRCAGTLATREVRPHGQDGSADRRDRARSLRIPWTLTVTPAMAAGTATTARTRPYRPVPIYRSPHASEHTVQRLTLAALVAVAIATPALAQPYGGPDAYPPRVPRGPYGYTEGGSNNTGGTRSVVISRGPTGADTVFSSSAVGGNVARPELAVPNGSAGGGSGTR